uniref:Adhesion G protein-coupled receptor B2 n=1 Tax=Astyanax mexicanus TaxID=7994 RepID=A0A8B9K5V8_ASTMX
MNTAGQLCLSVLSSLLALAWAVEPLGQSTPCSSLVAGVLYGSFSLRDLFPNPLSPTAGCSWTVENPDPTKYSLYFRFNRHAGVCLAFSPLVLPLDHYLPNQTCGPPLQPLDPEAVELCLVPGPHTFLQFDKNFVQLCLSAHSSRDSDEGEERSPEAKVPLSNSSQFTCGVLCRWFEECLRSGWGSGRDSVGCSITQTGCVCPNTGPPVPLLPATPHNRSVDPSSSHPVSPTLVDLLVFTVHGLWEEWSPWSLCSVTCGRGSRTRSRSCVAHQHGGQGCGGPEVQTKLCNIAVCPVEGQWLDWSPWSRCSVSCGVGSQQRQRRCSVSVHGWAECKGPHAETRDCTNPSCGETSYCPCFSTVPGTNPNKSHTPALLHRCVFLCAAPHEICRDEYQVSMTWKRASAGETVYNKCPSNATGSASRRCLLDFNGVAYWGPPSFARCISLEYRYLHLSLREHLAKGQRTLAGEGMSQIVRSLLELMSRRSYYSGDLLFSVEILRNVTDTFKRATYIPAPDDVQKFFQIVSLMLDMENLEKWEDAHQVSPGAVLLMRVVEDFIHLIGEAQKPFQSFLVVTTNLIITIQREPVSAVSSDINFPTKGRRGMKDWARSAEDKLFIPKEVFTLSSDGEWSPAVIYNTLFYSSESCRNGGAVDKQWSHTLNPSLSSSLFLSPLFHSLINVMCVFSPYPINREAGEEIWDTEGCQTLPSPAVHTKCLCSKISTFAVLAQKAKDPVSASFTFTPNTPTSQDQLCTHLALYIRSERSIILVNFCLSILASNVLILVGQSQTLSKGLCTVTAAFLHFFFLASFCWVLTEAWQSYLAVIGKMRTRLIRKRFLCLGWGLPALVVAVSVGFTRARGYGTASYCWLSLEGGLLYAFVGPAAVIVLVNMLIGIVVFNKLMSRDGISDKSKKQRAGPPLEARSRLLLKCSKCGVISSTAMSSSTASSAMASLWSSCVVLPLLALTWMSAVLAITDRRSTLFQVLFAVFDSVQGFVIITVHCAMRREVQDAVRCRMGGCKDDSENSPDSCKNGQVQIMVNNISFHLISHKTVNTCNPATITGTLSRISLDDEDDPKLAAHQEGVNFSSLPGNIPPPNLLVQVPPLGPLNELNEQPLKKEVNVEQGGQQQRQRSAPVYLCTESGLGWARPPPNASEPVGGGGGVAGEGDYMVLPRRTVSLKPPPPPPQDEGKPLNITVEDPPFPPPPSPLTLHPAESERKRVRYSELDFEKVMHTRKRHSELYHELNHSTKFHTIDRYNRDPVMTTFKGLKTERRNRTFWPQSARAKVRPAVHEKDTL